MSSFLLRVSLCKDVRHVVQNNCHGTWFGGVKKKLQLFFNNFFVSVSSFGKIASIIAPFVSSSFDKTSIMIPSILFGVASAICAILVCFVGAEPPAAAGKVSDDEKTPLIK